MAEKIEAPFTVGQVEALNDYQSAGRSHPFTCRNRNDGQHQFRFGDYGVLIATAPGWVCADCDYTQHWAWAFMADPTGRAGRDARKGER